MRPRGQSASHADAVSRRLELLSAELRAVDTHTHIRPGGPSDPWQPPASLEPATTESTIHGPPAAASTRAPAGLPEPEIAAELPREASTGPPEVPVPGRHAARRRGGLVDLSAVQGRIALTSAHVAVVAVLIAVGLAVTCWWVLRDDPGAQVARGGTAQPLTTPLAEGAEASTAPGADATQAASELVVDVTGKVRRPGIVVLEPGSRVVDALKAAGGARPGVPLRDLNLARLLEDGEQIVVGFAPPPGVAASSAPDTAPESGSGELININTASATELEELTGVGPVTAAAIIDWRTTNGGFQSVDQLLEVDGIGEKTLEDLAPHVSVG